MSLRTTCVHIVEPVSAVMLLKFAIRNGRWETGGQGYALTNSRGILRADKKHSPLEINISPMRTFLNKVLIGLIQ